MLTLGRYIESSVKAGIRYIKASFFTKDDVRSIQQVTPFGFDCNPIKDTPTLYANSTIDGASFVIGYVNKNALAAPGETRIFSVDSNGSVKAYTWHKNDGKVVINGDDDNAVRYSELETAFNALKDKVNDHISKYNTHVHPYVNVSTPATTSVTTSTETPSTADITPAKIESILVPQSDS